MNNFSEWTIFSSIEFVMQYFWGSERQSSVFGP